MTLILFILFNQTPILNESFTNSQFPPPGWDTTFSDTTIDWFRNYYSTGNPDEYHARVRVYDASNWQRTGFSILTTLSLDLSSSAGEESLFFWYRFSRDSTNLGPDDTMYIEITNDEISWFSLLKIGKSGQIDNWVVARISLLSYNTFNSARVRFRYEDKPNDSLYYQNGNFWLDSVKVISYYEDTIPPIVLMTFPIDGDTGIAVSSNILFYFNEPIDQQTIIPQGFNVQGQLSGIHNGTFLYDSINYLVTFNPTIDFSYAETVYVTVYDTIKDLAGNRLDGDNNGIPGGNYQFLFFTTLSPDTIPPAGVTNLIIIEIGSDNVKLRWTAPGDDGNSGRASFYDIRYANFNITEANFNTATECLGEPPPSNAGDTDSFIVFGLLPQIQYYFALKTADEDSNWSLISNVPTCTTTAALETLLIINEFLPNPETYDHNNNGNYGDADEEFIEIFNKDLHNINLQNYQIKDFVGTNTLTIPVNFNIPAYGYLLLYASGEGFIISGDMDTLLQGNWLGNWPNLDQTGDTIVLWDGYARELDRKGYIGSDVVSDFSIARLPNGTDTWINNAFPTPGRSNGTEYVWPIAVAFKDLDSNYIPDLLDSVVTITGIVTAPPGTFSSEEAYTQDNTGGVCLYGDFPITLDYGDSIIVTGQVDQYRGKNELTNFTYQRIKQGCSLPEPIEIDGAVVNTEQYEGSLVKIRVSFIEGFLLEATSYNAWDPANNLFTIYIDSYTNIPGHLAPLDSFTLTGIKGQYSYDSIPNNDYQIMPRDTFDFSHLFILPQVKSISVIQAPDSDGVSSNLLDSTVAIEGVVIGPNYVFTSGSPSFYIQDQTGGINIYNMDGDNQFNSYIDSLGARLRIVGKVTEYNGLTEISNGYGWFLGMDTLPLPKELGTNRFLTEGMEGTLIKFKAVIKTLPYKTGDGYNFEVMNGDCGITVRFTGASGINPLTIKKDEMKIIIGIVGQYDPEKPYTTGYQVLLRMPEDLQLPSYDSTSAVPLLDIVGPKTFIPGKSEQAKININSPINYTLNLDVYDMNGRKIKNLYDGSGGPHEILWDGKDDYRRPCKIGIYLLNLKATKSNGKSEFKRELIVIGTEF